MRLAISCLGMAIHTEYPIDTWKGYLQLRHAENFSGMLADEMRKHLALNTFLKALDKRNRSMKKKVPSTTAGCGSE